MHYGVVKLSMLLNILQELRRSLVCAARLWITLYVLSSVLSHRTTGKQSSSETVAILLGAVEE